MPLVAQDAVVVYEVIQEEQRNVTSFYEFNLSSTVRVGMTAVTLTISTLESVIILP